MQVSEFISALSHFRHLEVLQHSGLISEFNSSEEIENMLRQIIFRCDRLRCISMWSCFELGVICEIIRHGSGRIDWIISALNKQGSFFMD